MFLVVPAEHLEEVKEKLRGNDMWVFAETGGKTAYVNQAPETGKSPIASLEEKLLVVAEQ